MANFNLNLKQTVSPKLTQRTLLLGRVKIAQAIELRESEWASALSEAEKDPLFQELLCAKMGTDRIIRYRRYGRGVLSGQFYEMQDENVVGGEGVAPEVLLEKKKHLLKLIQKIGQENFEKHFLYREESLDLPGVATACGMTLDEATQLQDFILEMSVQSEFYHPSSLQPHNMVRPTLIGRVFKNDDGTYGISFFSPHLARGLYDINRDALKKWQKDKKFDRTQATRLRKMVGLLELSNLKQGAFWKVCEYVLHIQREYLDTQDYSKLAPVSLRYVARTIQFAPSTISRVMAAKSVLLPWDHEVPLSFFMPGQRKVVLDILEKVMGEHGSSRVTDAALARQIEATFGISVSRRTITACRHIIEAKQGKKAA